MYLSTRRKIWTPFSCLVLLKCYHVVFSQFKFPANLAQLVVSKMHCLYANAVMQPSVQHCPWYMAWKTKVHSWRRHCYLCINALMWREERWLQGLFDPPSYIYNIYPLIWIGTSDNSSLGPYNIWHRGFIPSLKLSITHIVIIVSWHTSWKYTCRQQYRKHKSKTRPVKPVLRHV